MLVRLLPVNLELNYKIKFLSGSNTSEFKRCILDGLADSKVPSCTEPVLEIYEKYVDSIYSNIINSICDGNEESTDRCKKLSKNVKITSKRFDHITAFPAIFEVFENL